MNFCFIRITILLDANLKKVKNGWRSVVCCSGMAFPVFFEVKKGAGIPAPLIHENRIVCLYYCIFFYGGVLNPLIHSADSGKSRGRLWIACPADLRGPLSICTESSTDLIHHPFYYKAGVQGDLSNKNNRKWDNLFLGYGLHPQGFAKFSFLSDRKWRR
ncbi:MAG: hypothetical protein H6559_33490 [Lewinellaceae bacterium]|nr:hypothetical protein [Lewinellaceae bacterium]